MNAILRSTALASALTLSTLSLADTPQKAAETLVIEEWAREPLVEAPVALDFDDQGYLYVAQTRRRGNGSLDIRRKREWVRYDLSLTSIAERRAFYHKVLAPEHSAENTWLDDFNHDGLHDWQDLAVISESIYRLRDSNRDGKADQQSPIDNSIRSDITGIAAGILQFEGRLYVAAEPDLYLYTDPQGDGSYSQRETISTGYQVHIGQGGHNMSGLTLGPDGRIYWSVADKGLNVTTREGRHFYYPNRGAVMRCEPDGSQTEVFAMGVRNAQELAFDAFGNLFSVDNDGDFPTERERLVYITEGSDHGWRFNWQWLSMQDFANTGEIEPYLPWMDEGMSVPEAEGQPAFITPPLENFSNGPCGFTYNPGTALNESLRDCFFLTEFKPKITAFRMKPKGASFRREDVGTARGGGANTGLAFGPDGALYSGGWVQGMKVVPEGRIYKIDDPAAADWDLRKQTQQLLSAGMEGRSIEELYQLLGHADQRIRIRAQVRLAGSDEDGRQALQKAALVGNTLLQRIHGIWGIGQLARRDNSVMEPLIPLLNDPEIEVRVQLCRIIGDADLQNTQATQSLMPLLRAPEARARFFAAIALGKIQASQAFDPLCDMLADNDDRDPYLRHAGSMGLVGSSQGNPSSLTELSQHPSAAVRLAAVVALRRLAAPEVSIFLSDPDERIATEAARAIHDDFSLPEALPALAALLDQREMSKEALIRRSLNANYRLGDPDALNRIARYAAKQNAAPLMRQVALTSMEMWEKPDVIDAVDGRFRQLSPRPDSTRQALFSELLPQLGSQTDPRVLQHAARMVSKWNLKAFASSLYQWYGYASADTLLKVEILRSLSQLDDPQLAPLAQEALASSEAILRQAGRAALAQSEGISPLEQAIANLQDGSIEDKQRAVYALAADRSDASDQLLARELSSLSSGKLDPAISLDLLLAAKQREGSPILAKPLAKLSVNEWDLLESGGSPERGKSLVQGHPIAQCIRCHLLDGSGSDLGPELRSVAQRATPAYLVESILYPSRQIAPGYGMVFGNKKDGTAFSGTLISETDQELQLQLADGSAQVLAKSDIAEQSFGSSMPPLKDLLTPSEVRDIVSFLLSLKGEQDPDPLTR